MANNMNETRINGMLTLGESPAIIIPDDEIEVITNERAVTYSVPTWAEASSDIPAKPTYGKFGRISTNNFGTQNISNLKDASPEEVMSAIGADFHVVSEYLTRVNPVTGEVEKVREPLLYNSNTGKEICMSTPSYSKKGIIDYDEAIYCFFSLLDEIKKHGYKAEPAVAKIYDNDGKMFLQYRVYGGNIAGDDVDTYLTLLTSHDAGRAMTIALSMVRLFCQNQINRCLKEASNTMAIRHSLVGKEKVRGTISDKYKAAIAAGHNSAESIMGMVQTNLYGMNAYLKYLEEVKIDDRHLFSTMMAIHGYKEGEEINSRAATRVINDTRELLACYAMPDVNKTRGTALGAYYAYSDYLDHVRVGRNLDSVIERSVYGNEKLPKFIDTLIEIAK